MIPFLTDFPPALRRPAIGMPRPPHPSTLVRQTRFGSSSASWRRPLRPAATDPDGAPVPARRDQGSWLSCACSSLLVADHVPPRFDGRCRSVSVLSGRSLDHLHESLPILHGLEGMANEARKLAKIACLRQ